MDCIYHVSLFRLVQCRFLTLIQILGLTVLSVIAPVAYADTNRTIVLNTTGKEPLSTLDQKGVMDLIAVEAFRRCGYELRLETLPAERALRIANKGVIDGDLVRIRGLEELYPDLIRVPEKLMDWYFVAFSKQALNLSAGWESLANRNIAFITGWKIYEKNAPESATVTKVRNAEQLFTLLSRNRTDIALYNRVSGNYIIKKLKITEIREQATPLAVSEMFIYLNRKHSRLVPKVAKALAEMKADGTYERIWNNNIATVE